MKISKRILIIFLASLSLSSSGLFAGLGCSSLRNPTERTSIDSLDDSRVLAVSANGKTIVKIIDGSIAKILRRDDEGSSYHLVECHNQYLTERPFVISLDGNVIINPFKAHLNIYRWKNGNWEKSYEYCDASIRSVAISSDGNCVLVGLDSNSSRVMEWNGYYWSIHLICHNEPVASVAVSADGEVFISGSEDGVVKILWHGDTGWRSDIIRNEDKVDFVATSSDGNTLAVVAKKKLKIARKKGSFWQIAYIKNLRESVSSVVVSEDGSLVDCYSPLGTKIFRKRIEVA